MQSKTALLSIFFLYKVIETLGYFSVFSKYATLLSCLFFHRFDDAESLPSFYFAALKSNTCHRKSE